MLPLLVGLSLAAPPALLGPDGPTWIGPLPPAASAEQDPPATVVVVDPSTGILVVEERDSDTLLRSWDGRRWEVDGGGIAADWPAQNGFSYDLGRDGRLISATDHKGRKRRYFYDEKGRLDGILWSDGSRLEVRYDDEGRVEELRGPGTRLIRLRYGDELRVEELPGGSLTIRGLVAEADGGRTIEVADRSGRTVRTFYETAGGVERVVGWEDPRGQRTSLRFDEDRIDILSPGGGRWTASVDEARRLLSLKVPGGGVYRWDRDEQGRVVQLSDPTGRSESWKRDGEGRISAVSQGGSITRIERDPAGRVLSFSAAGGASIRLQRDPKGRVSTIIDPIGNPVQLLRGTDGVPESILGRAGAEWKLGTDGLGRVVKITDPVGKVVELRRDLGGEVVEIVDSVHGATRIRRSADGRITGVEAPDGRSTGFARDSLGRIVRVLQADGSVLRIERDRAGEIAWVALAREGGEVGVEVERDLNGLPLRAGTVRWFRDVTGEVIRIEDPKLSLSLERDAAGRIVGARAEGWSVAVQRDARGQPVSYQGNDGELVLVRDGQGAITAERLGRVELRLLRDPRGLIDRATIGDHSWRWTRDAAGLPLVIEGPGEMRVGVDRDPGSRPVLVRYPGGTLLTIRHDRDLVHLTLQSPGGEVLLRRSVSAGIDGRPRWIQEGDGERQAWRYDPLGNVIAIETGDAPTWTWSPEIIKGPEGQVLLRDGQGEASEARIHASLPAWGVVGEVATFFREPEGLLSGLGGDQGAARLRHDVLGRLVEVDTAGQRWLLSYDPLGRLAAVTDPSGARRELRFLPGKQDPTPELLLAGTDQPWVPGPGGPAAVRTPGGPEAVVMVGGQPRWVVDAGGNSIEILSSLTGLADSGAARLAGPGGALQVFAGGPLVAGDTALDPLSGRPTRGLSLHPWQGAPLLGPAGRARLDPRAWAPRASWHQPLRILEALGQVEPVVEGGWLPASALDPALPWLPAGLEGGESPLGPPHGSLPVDEDPITEALILSVLPGARPVGPGLVLETVLSAELDLLSELPPGLQVPGLPIVRPAGIFFEEWRRTTVPAW